ncbi:MAG: hypothetical protein ACLTMP_11030 [Eggerthella lenta]
MAPSTCRQCGELLDEGGNADSLCLIADADIDGDGASSGVRTAGGIERDQLRALIDEGLVDSVDLYKVGHHGSRTPSATGRRPSFSRIALVSAGARSATAIRRRTRSIGSRPRAHASSAPTSREMFRAN